MIAPSGLYWVTDVPSSGLTVSPDGRSAELRLTGVAIIDQPRWPALDADARPARLDITMTWQATDEPYELDEPAKHYRFRGWKATSRLAARATVPSINFTWKSDAIETSSAGFAIIGEEANGKYYSAK
jgi:hypothetical protein